MSCFCWFGSAIVYFVLSIWFRCELRVSGPLHTRQYFCSLFLRVAGVVCCSPVACVSVYCCIFLPVDGRFIFLFMRIDATYILLGVHKVSEGGGESYLPPAAERPYLCLRGGIKCLTMHCSCSWSFPTYAITSSAVEH